MKHRSLPGLLLALLVTIAPALAQNTAREESISASCLLAYGRPALGGELADPAFADKSLADLVRAHRKSLSADPERQRQVDDRAFLDAFGVRPSATQPAKAEQGPGVTYIERLQQHLDRLAKNPDENRQVIDRAYQLVIRRPAYAEEHEYWQRHGTLPYVLLVGAIENWAERNQPGLMVTNGTPSISINSRFLRTQRLSLPVANEARTLLGLPVWSDVARLSNPGYNVVAVGSGNLASVGGMHFMPVGGGPLAGE